MALERRPEYNTSRCQPRAITDRWSAAGMDTTRHQCDRLVSLLEPQGGWGALPLGGPRTRPRSRLMTPPPPLWHEAEEHTNKLGAQSKKRGWTRTHPAPWLVCGWC